MSTIANNTTFAEYAAMNRDQKETFLDSICENISFAITLKDVIALHNNRGYFNKGMGEYDYLILHISVLEKYLKNAGHGTAAEFLMYNRIICTCNNKFPEYFLYDGYQDTITLYDHDSLSNYMSDILEATIFDILESDPGSDIIIYDYIRDIIRNNLNDPLMQW